MYRILILMICLVLCALAGAAQLPSGRVQSSASKIFTAVKHDAAGLLTDAEREATKSAATIMAMNNIYYRFLHLSDDKQFGQLPAKLRMNIIGNPGVPKIDFELYSLAVSALTGCGACINAHVKTAQKEGITAEGIQSTIRIAAVINAAAQAAAIDGL